LFFGARSFSPTPTFLQVKCALQFWDKSLNVFRTYSEFFLSEHQVSHLDLPITTDRKKISVAEKWRILVTIIREPF
jgi:hypothetical protein